MSSVPAVTDQDFETVVLQSDIPVLVDFHAVWCGPCKSLAPIVDELAGEYTGKVRVVSVDIDQAPGVASSHGIMSVPTLIVFKGGQPAQKMVGFRPKPEIKKALDSVL